MNETPPDDGERAASDPDSRDDPGDPVVDDEGGDEDGDGEQRRRTDEMREDWRDLSRGRVVLWVVAFAFAVVFAFLVWQYVGTVVVGVFAYYVTRPVYSRFVEPRVGSRTIGVAITLFTVGLPVLALVAWTVFVAVRALADLLDGDLGGQVEAFVEPYADLDMVFADLGGTFETLVENPMRLADVQFGASVTDALNVLFGALGQLFNVLLHAFVVLVITFYLLRDDHRIAAWARDTFVEPDGVLDAYFVAVDRDLKNVFFGNILNALLTGFLAVVTFVALNIVSPASASIPEAVLVGLLVGVASLIPVIGIKLVTLPLALYLFARVALVDPADLWFPVTFLAVSFVIVDYIPDQLLRPYVSGRTLHVGAVMIAYTLGPLLFGWYGIFLGPLVLVFLFEFARIVVPWLYDPDAAPFVDSPAEPAGGLTTNADASGEQTQADATEDDDARSDASRSDVSQDDDARSDASRDDDAIGQ